MPAAVEAVGAAASSRGTAGIDILVNNAGITRDQLMLRMKRDDWDAVIATNLTARVHAAAQAVLRPMIKQRSGRIITISSVVGQMGNAGQANYAASKAGLIGLAKRSRARWPRAASRSTWWRPGLIDTDMTRAMAEEARRTWASQIPLGRLGTPRGRGDGRLLSGVRRGGVYYGTGSGGQRRHVHVGGSEWRLRKK